MFTGKRTDYKCRSKNAIQVKNVKNIVMDIKTQAEFFLNFHTIFDIKQK